MEDTISRHPGVYLPPRQFRECRLVDPDAFLAAPDGGGNNGRDDGGAAWDEIRDYLVGARQDNVVWLHRGAFLVCGPGPAIAFSWDRAGFDSEFQRPYIFAQHTDMDYTLTGRMRIEIYTRDGADGNQILMALARRVLCDPNVKQILVDRRGPSPPLSGADLGLIVGTVPPPLAQRTVAFRCRRDTVAQVIHPFMDEEQRAILTQCLPTVQLMVSVDNFGPALIDVLRDQRGPANLRVNPSSRPGAPVGDAQVFEALALNSVVRQLAISHDHWAVEFNMSAILAMVRSLPPRLSVLCLPRLHLRPTIHEWRELWTAVCGHPTLAEVQFPLQPTADHRDFPPADMVARLVVMFECMKETCALASVRRSRSGFWAMNNFLYDRWIQPLLEANRNRTPLSVFEESLTNPRFLRDQNLFVDRAYDGLRSNVSAWIPRTARALKPVGIGGGSGSEVEAWWTAEPEPPASMVARAEQELLARRLQTRQLAFADLERLQREGLLNVQVDLPSVLRRVEQTR
jgi:hypothetical protein